MTESLQPRMPTAPHARLPAGVCDSHAHVFGPFTVFPTRLPSSYPLPDAPVQKYLTMLDTIGAAHGVLVQPAPYATDPGALVHALALGKGRLRGVGVADASVSPLELAEWARAGIRGLRFVDMLDPAGKTYPGAVSADALPSLARRMLDNGLHAQLWADIDHHAQHLPRLIALGVPLVLDHMACLRTSDGVESSSFRTILRHVERGEIYVKLAVCRVSTAAPRYEDLRAYHDAFVAANPERILWGSDWPFVRMGDRSPDVGQLIDLEFEWLPNDSARHKLLVENPARLYGFLR